MTVSDYVHNYNMATECGVTTDMTEYEICNAIAEWVNGKFDYLTAEVVETIEDTNYIVKVWLNTFPNIKACWGTTGTSNYYRCRLLFNDTTYTSMSSSTSTNVDNVYSVSISVIGRLNFYIVKSAQGFLFGFYNKNYSRTGGAFAIISTVYGDSSLLGYGRTSWMSDQAAYIIRPTDTGTASSQSYVTLPISDASDIKYLVRLPVAGGTEIMEYLYMSNNVQQLGSPYVLEGYSGRYFVDYAMDSTSYCAITMEITEGDNDILYQARES